MGRKRHPESNSVWHIDDDEERVDIPFIPVPSQTRRRDGWTPERQQDFIQALARGASAAAAARQVGKSVRSAYRLCDREGGIEFARAWDQAADIGRARIIDNVIDRAQHGSWVPIVRRGRIVRMEYRYFDKLAIAVLNGRPRPGERRPALSPPDAGRASPRSAGLRSAAGGTGRGRAADERGERCPARNLAPRAAGT